MAGLDYAGSALYDFDGLICKVDALKRKQLPIAKKMNAVIALLQTKKEDKTAMEHAQLGEALLGILKSVVVGVSKLQSEINLDLMSNTPKEALNRETLERMVNVLEKLYDIMERFLITPLEQRFMEHTKDHWGKYLLCGLAGGVLGVLAMLFKLHCAVIGCCGGGLGAASWAAIGAAGGVGLVAGVVVAGVGIVIYNACSKTELEKHQEAIREAIRRIEKNFDRDALKTLQLEIDTFHSYPCMDLPASDIECIVCKEEMVKCTHRGGAHDGPLCCVFPFECRHSLCFSCAQRVQKCPLCTAPKKIK